MARFSASLIFHSPSQLRCGFSSGSGIGARIDEKGASSGMRGEDRFFPTRLLPGGVVVRLDCAPTVRLLLLCTVAFRGDCGIGGNGRDFVDSSPEGVFWERNCDGCGGMGFTAMGAAFLSFSNVNIPRGVGGGSDGDLWWRGKTSSVGMFSPSVRVSLAMRLRRTLSGPSSLKESSVGAGDGGIVLIDKGRGGRERGAGTDMLSEVDKDGVRVFMTGSEAGGGTDCKRSTSRRGSSFEFRLLWPPVAAGSIGAAEWSSEIWVVVTAARGVTDEEEECENIVLSLRFEGPASRVSWWS